jgi:membrane-associated phospholipid phosphatase
MFSNFINTLLQYDEQLFTKLNSGFTHPIADGIFPWWRESITWTPLYLFIIILLFNNYGKRTWYWLLCVGLTIALSDQLSSGLIKPFFHRLRPCNNPDLVGTARLLLNHCSGGFSFTSSHATNHFAVALFVIKTLQPIMQQYKYAWLFWAASISYGQVYVGVHYPLDIVCGAILGTIVGSMVAAFYNRRIAVVYSLFK